nr:hypothetical protein [Rhizobium sp. ACO-34A]
MADSDISRTLPSITQGNLLRFTERFLSDKAAEQARSNAGDIDPVLAKWDEWFVANSDLARLCRVQQHLETELMRNCASPVVEIPLPGSKDLFLAHTEDEIDAVLKGEELDSERNRAKEQLRTRCSAWNAADEIVGYSRAKKTEEEASDVEFRLVEELWAMPAQSVLAAAGKVHSIVRHGAPKVDIDDFPWPAMRLLLADLLVMSGAAPFTPAACQ